MYNCTFRIFIMLDLKNLCRRILQVDILPKEEFETFNKWMMTSTRLGRTGTMPNVSMNPADSDDEYSDDELRRLLKGANKNSSGNTKETRHVNRSSSAGARRKNTRPHHKLQRPQSEGATQNNPAKIPDSMGALVERLRLASNVKSPTVKHPRAGRFGRRVIGKNRPSVTVKNLANRIKLMQLRGTNRATLDGKTEGGS